MDPDQIEVARVRIGAPPVINAVLDRLGFAGLVASALGEPDGRCVIAPAQVIGVLVGNLAVGRRPLYGLSAWASGYAPGLLGLAPGEAGLLNDDRVGRALDRLFVADRSSLLSALSVATIRRFDIDVSSLVRSSRFSGGPLHVSSCRHPARGL